MMQQSRPDSTFDPKQQWTWSNEVQQRYSKIRNTSTHKQNVWLHLFSPWSATKSLPGWVRNDHLSSEVSGLYLAIAESANHVCGCRSITSAVWHAITHQRVGWGIKGKNNWLRITSEPDVKNLITNFTLTRNSLKVPFPAVVLYALHLSAPKCLDCGACLKFPPTPISTSHLCVLHTIHSDPCRWPRWAARRESFRLMLARSVMSLDAKMTTAKCTFRR